MPKLPHLPIMLLLAAAMILGVVTLPHYGESWDEADIRRYSEYAVGAYRYLLHPQDLAPFDTNLNLYGPAYVAPAGLLAGLATRVAPQLSAITAWHSVYFATFLVGVLLLYLLARRWMSDAAAFGAALLFITQPLFWGHAFINPKDIPFLTFFVASIYLGLRMIDSIQASARIGGSIAVAAVILGLTSSFRVLGPLAGVLVVVAAVWQLRARAILPALLYATVSGLTMYISWPYLWGAPISHFLDSLNTMASFPFTGRIFFASQLYEPGKLPLAYVPTILGIQLTESALLLIPAGLLLGLIQYGNRQVQAFLALFIGWFLLPTSLIVFGQSTLYDNGRQLFFLFPPLFLAAGLAMDWVFRLLRPPGWRAAFLLLVALPGVLIGARLHPYEYAYYNSLVHGTGGAFKRFDTDYWGTSYTELTAYANASLPTGSRLLVYGPVQIVSAAARPDLQVTAPREGVVPQCDYVVLLSRASATPRLCAPGDTAFSVGRRGAVFAQLCRIPAGEPCK